MHSKLKKNIYKDAGIKICGHSNFDICKVFEKRDQFEKNGCQEKVPHKFSI